jgi:pilus assembly protein HofM
MAFKTWQTGVHIQQDRVLIVALAREKSGWCCAAGGHSSGEGIIRDGKICQPEQLVDALRDWRKTLPHYHRVFLSFPAARTLQRSLPRPTVALRDSEQLSWLGARSRANWRCLPIRSVSITRRIPSAIPFT